MNTIQDSCWILDAGYWMLDAGYWMLDAGYWMLDIIKRFRVSLCLCVLMAIEKCKISNVKVELRK